MGVLYANNAIGRLSAGIDSDDTTLTLLAGEGAKFPAITAGSGDWYPCTLINVAGQREIVSVTARNGDVFTIARAQEGTGAIGWIAQDRFELRVTAAAYQQLVPDSRKVNNKPLTADISLGAADVGALPYTDGKVTAPVSLLNLTGLFTSSSSQPLDMGCLGGVPGDFLIDIHTDGTETEAEFKYRITFKNDGSGVNLGGQIEGAYTGSNGFADQYHTQATFHQTVTSQGTSEYWPIWKQRVVTGQYDEIKWVSSMGWLLGNLDWVLQLRPEVIDEAAGQVERLFSFMRDGSFLLPVTPAAEDNSNKAATTAFVVAHKHVHTAAEGNSDIVASSYGQVGTYSMLWVNSGTAVIGSTYPGSSLLYSNARGVQGGAPSGTWKLVANGPEGGSDEDTRTSLWIRIDDAALYKQPLTLFDLKWDNTEHSSLTAMVVFDGTGGMMPFTASPDDIEPHSRLIFERAAAGEYGEVAEFIPPTPAELAARDNPPLRRQQMKQAAEQVTHWDMMGDPAQAASWRSYYRELYVLETNPDWPLVEQWPVSPTENER